MPKTKVTGHSYTQSNQTFSILSPVMGTETGDNTGNTLYGGSTNDTLYGAGGDDYLYDQRGNDKVYGGSDDDYIRAGGGIDSYFGGSGKDYLSYYDSTGGVKVNLTTNNISHGWANNDVISGIESIGGSQTGGDTITGTTGSNTIKTYGGDDSVYALSGVDRIYLGDGNDYLRATDGATLSADSFYGGAGTDDYISYWNSGTGVILNLATGATGGAAAGDVINGFESVGGSKTAGDIIHGTTGNNRINSYGGDDKVYAKAGTDLVFLGSGDDYLRATDGASLSADTFYGGSGSDDYISYWDSQTGINLNLSDTSGSGAAAGDRYYGFESVGGSNHASDVIYGTSGNNRIRGHGGDDSIYSGDGADRIYGGSGDDYINAGPDYVWPATTTDYDVVFGGSGADRILSGSGNDTIYGGSGDDYITGGQDGIATVYGGAGEDEFFLNEGGASIYMSDFADDEDTFFLDKEYFDRDHLTAASLLTLAEEIDGNVKIEDSFGRVIFFEDITKTQLLDDISII